MTHQDTPPPADRTLKVPHLVFGLLFLGVAGIWALGQSGVIGLAASLASGRNKRRRSSEAYASPYVEESYLATYDAPAYDTPAPEAPAHDAPAAGTPATTSPTETPRTDDDFGDTAPITEEK